MQLDWKMISSECSEGTLAICDKDYHRPMFFKYFASLFKDILIYAEVAISSSNLVLVKKSK